MKKLLSILGGVGMIATTGATVISCGNKEKEATPREALQAQINRAQATMDNQNENEWIGVTETSKSALTEAINKATEILNNVDSSEVDLNSTIADLGLSIDAFVAALPANIITEVINQQRDIKDLVNKDWTYSSFFNMNGEKDANEDGDRVLDLFYRGVHNSARNEHDYTEDEANALQKLLMPWSQENINLVYINVDDAGNQKVEKKLTSEKQEKDTVEQLFFDAVKEEFNEELNAEFWKNHPKLSLGISFDKNADGRKLPDHAKEFWTFTFKTN